MPNDPFADAMNTSGLQGLIGPNPYLQYTGQIPMAGYRGAPTDAAGNPIASFTQAQQQHDAWNAANPAQPPGTTLNNTNPFAGVQIPQGMNTQVAQPRGGLDFQQWNALTPQQRSAAQGPLDQYRAGNSSAMTLGPNGTGATSPMGLELMNDAGSRWNQMVSQPSPAAASAPAAPTNPIDMRQAYLDALSNPGKVTTPGAQMLPGTSPTGPQSQPSVLSQFLSNNQPSTGGGGYSNQPFFQTLNALKQGATT